MRSKPLRGFLSIASAGLVAFTARASLADHYRVPSASMDPTVRVGDRIVVSKLAYGLRLPATDQYVVTFGSPARGDVVVLEPPETDHLGTTVDVIGSVLLKRVVAIGGDVVEVRDGHVRIDGEPVDVPEASFAEGGGPDFGPERVPDGQLLVLGDNRGNSRDGRSFGFVPASRVLGRAVAVFVRDGHAVLESL